MPYRIVFQGELVDSFNDQACAIDRLVKLALSGELIRANARAFLKAQGSFTCSPLTRLFDRPGLLRLERYECPFNHVTQTPKENNMDKTKALERLTALESEASALRKIIEAPEPAASLLTKPTPGKGEEYFGIIADSGVRKMYGSRSGKYVSLTSNPQAYAHGNIFQTEALAQAYAEAIDTMLLLRHQPGTEMANDACQQTVISVHNGSVTVRHLVVAHYKVEMISPCFATEEHAEAAIETVGKERLLHMFNTFHHVGV